MKKKALEKKNNQKTDCETDCAMNSGIIFIACDYFKYFCTECLMNVFGFKKR